MGRQRERGGKTEREGGEDTEREEKTGRSEVQ